MTTQQPGLILHIYIYTYIYIYIYVGVMMEQTYSNSKEETRKFRMKVKRDLFI